MTQDTIPETMCLSNSPPTETITISVPILSASTTRSVSVVCLVSEPPPPYQPPSFNLAVTTQEIASIPFHFRSPTVQAPSELQSLPLVVQPCFSTPTLFSGPDFDHTHTVAISATPVNITG